MAESQGHLTHDMHHSCPACENRIERLRAEISDRGHDIEKLTERKAALEEKCVLLGACMAQDKRRIADLEANSRLLAEFLAAVQPSCACGADEKEALLASHRQLMEGAA